MGLSRHRLGDIIENVDIRNTALEFGVSDVRGISNTKEMMPTKADMLNRALDSFKVVPPRHFVYNRRTTRMGDKFAITLNETADSVIVTDDYIVFHVKDENVLVSEYLFMFFNRPEFDRYVRFNSWGSATEMFVWESMCDVEIFLPEVDIQRKIVRMYRSLRNNIASYESNIEDLKLVCDALLDRVKKSARKVKVSDLLIPIDKRNKDLSIIGVQGINIEKSFFPSVASIDDSETTNYKIVDPDCFAFSGMQTGRDKCIRIALNEKELSIIVSPAYTVLKPNREIVLSHFILLWFSRKEVDRYGWFASDGSIRSNLDLERFFDMEIPVPTKSEQAYIVNIFKCFTERQKIASQLKELVNTLCPIFIKGSLATGS